MTEPGDENPIAAQRSNPLEPDPMYFAVSPFKLVVMSFCTLGLYEIYWYYMNWGIIRRGERSEIVPIGRAIFAYFFCYSLFKRIKDTAESQRISRSLAAGPLAVGWIILNCLYRLPDPLWLVAFLGVFFLIPVQKTVNEINAITHPSHYPNRKFTGWNIAAVIFGGLVFVLAVIGTLFPVD